MEKTISKGFMMYEVEFNGKVLNQHVTFCEQLFRQHQFRKTVFSFKKTDELTASLNAPKSKLDRSILKLLSAPNFNCNL